MNETSFTTAALADELPEVENYKALSLTAVLTLIAGLASLLVLVHPLLTAIPLVAITLGIVSLRTIATSPRHIAGKSLAVVGLCLGTMFLGWGLGGHFVHQWLVRQQAREFADDWLKILATGDKYRAHQLHVASEYRLDPQTPIQQAYMTNDSAGDSMRNFYHSNPVLDRFLAAGRDPHYQFEEISLQKREGLGEQVVLKYRLLGQGESFPFWITVRRTYSNEHRQTDWEIYTVSADPPTVN